jgi:hypothetical protein
MSQLDWDGGDNLVAAPIEHRDLIAIARKTYGDPS